MLLPVWHSDSSVTSVTGNKPRERHRRSWFPVPAVLVFQSSKPCNLHFDWTNHLKLSHFCNHTVLDCSVLQKTQLKPLLTKQETFHPHSTFGKWPQLAAGVQGQLKEHFDLNIKIQQSQCPYLIYILPRWLLRDGWNSQLGRSMEHLGEMPPHCCHWDLPGETLWFAAPPAHSEALKSPGQ